MSQQWPLPLLMTVVYLLARRWQPRYAVVLSSRSWLAQRLLHGRVMCIGKALIGDGAQPVWVMPDFSVAALIGMALPLFIITMAGTKQFRGRRHACPWSCAASFTCHGLDWYGERVASAPFGAFALNLAAITASICSSEEAHTDKTKRYTAAISAGIFYILMGLAGASV
jgi:benzoate membrane transport protein